MLSFIKWSSLQKSVSVFTPKMFCEIDPSLLGFNIADTTYGRLKMEGQPLQKFKN